MASTKKGEQHLESLTQMSKKQYSDFWEAESCHLENQGIYKCLNEITPIANTLEIGCGSGISTQYLATSRKVLSLDNNAYLIKKAKQRTKNGGGSAEFIRANLFELSAKDSCIIQKFSPKGIVCWLMGSNPDIVDKHTPGSLLLSEKPKKYRENVEDILVSENFCSNKVEWIHLANRAAVVTSFSEQEGVKETKDDYDTHVFSKIGFEVVDVRVFEWRRDGSNFMYVNAPNANPTGGPTASSVISILARRKK